MLRGAGREAAARAGVDSERPVEGAPAGATVALWVGRVFVCVLNVFSSCVSESVGVCQCLHKDGSGSQKVPRQDVFLSK